MILDALNVKWEIYLFSSLVWTFFSFEVKQSISPTEIFFDKLINLSKFNLFRFQPSSFVQISWFCRVSKTHIAITIYKIEILY